MATADAQSSTWIVSKRFDLTYFIGSTLSSYVMLYLFYELGIPALLLWWIWVVFFDGPHLFATYARTYFDREERRVHGKLLHGSLLILLIPFLVLGIDTASESRIAFVTFVFIFTLYQWWHVVRQHYGFMVLYQKRNGESAGSKNKIDFWFFHLIMYIPYFSVMAQNETFASKVPFLAYELAGIGGLPELLNNAAIVLLLAYGMYCLRLGMSGVQLNLPKLVLFAAVIPLPLIICTTSIAASAPYILLAATTTIYHNIQYQGIVWYYTQNRYHSETAKKKGQEKFGCAPKLTHNFLYYYAAAILFTVSYRYLLWGWDYTSQLPFVATVRNFLPLGEGEMLRTLGILFAMALSLHHFYLDQKIWKVSRDKGLQKDLRV